MSGAKYDSQIASVHPWGDETDERLHLAVDPNDPAISWVRFGDVAVPGEFESSITFVDPRLPKCHLRIRLENGRPLCADFRLLRADSGDEITGAMLREIPVGACVREAVAHQALMFTRDETDGFGAPFDLEGSPAWNRKVPGMDAGLGASWSQMEQVRGVASASRRQPRRGIPLTDDDLRSVAEAHRAARAQGKHTTEAVMEAFYLSRPTANRWIAKARARGFLAPPVRRTRF
jgi:Family of unknown function (DUF6214)